MIAAIPTESRHTEQVVSALKRLIGRRKVKMAYSDVAPEFEAAMSELRIPLDHSLPGKPNNNSLAERTNQEIINTVATAMLHAGLPAQYWSFALNCVTRNLNIIEDVEGDGDSAWKRMTGDDFKGKAIPFGANVFFKPTDTREKTYGHKFDPKGIPGVFAGIRGDYRTKLVPKVSSVGYAGVCQREPVHGRSGSTKACSTLPN